MMRWLTGLGPVVVLLGIVSGCTQRFMSEKVYNEAHSSLMLPPSMELAPALSASPLTELMPKPPTVSSPDRPPHYLSLQEAIAIALENGASGRVQPGPDGDDTSLAGGTIGRLTSQSDAMRVVALDPAAAGAAMEGTLAKFDAQYVWSVNWTNTDNLQQGLSSFSNGSNGSFNTGFYKPLAWGGVAGVTFTQNYQLLSAPPTGVFNILNPLWSNSFALSFELPLWRSAGTYINQLLPGGFTPTTGFANLPPIALNQFAGRLNLLNAFGNSGGPAFDGILIARLKFDQSRAEFERKVHFLVLNTEVAYWELYNAYGQLYSFEQSLRIAHRAWMIAHHQLQIGKTKVQEYAPVRGQYEEFRGQRAASLGNVLDAERRLRALIGMPLEDGTRLIPITPPELAHYNSDWNECQQGALNRPEIVLARESLKLDQYNLEVANNFLKPDLRVGANYTPLGFGTRLDGNGTLTDGTGGPQTNNALRSLADGRFANAQIGVTLNMPLGFRLENANVRFARLALAASYYFVKDQEERALQILMHRYQKVDEWHKLIEIRRMERRYYGEAVDAQFKKVVAGGDKFDVTFLDFQSKLADAQVKEFQAIAEYNKAITRLERAKGSILRYNNVHITEGQLPQCAQERAVDHERARSEALVIRERPDPLSHPGRIASTTDVPVTDVPQPLPIFQEKLAPVESPAGADKLLPPPHDEVKAPAVPDKKLPAKIGESATPLPPSPVSGNEVFRPSKSDELPIRPANELIPGVTLPIPVAPNFTPSPTPPPLTPPTPPPLTVTPPAPTTLGPVSPAPPAPLPGPGH